MTTVGPVGAVAAIFLKAQVGLQLLNCGRPECGCICGTVPRHGLILLFAEDPSWDYAYLLSGEDITALQLLIGELQKAPVAAGIAYLWATAARPSTNFTKPGPTTMRRQLGGCAAKCVSRRARQTVTESC